MTDAPQNAKLLSRAGHVAWRRVGDETIVLDLRDKQIYALNAAGGYFWHALDGRRTASDLLRRAGSDESAGSLVTFLEALEKLGLAVDEPGPVETVVDASIDPPADLSAPSIVWQEEMRTAVGASCAFLPGQNPLCTGGPFS